MTETNALLVEIRDLLRKGLEVQSASALVLESLHALKMQPILERRHLEAQQRAHISAAECERDRVRIAAELERAKRPRLWASGVGIARVSEEPGTGELPAEDEGPPT